MYKVMYQTKEAFRFAVLYQAKQVLLLDTSTDSPLSGRLPEVIKIKKSLEVSDYSNTWSAVVNLTKQNKIEIQ